MWRDALVLFMPSACVIDITDSSWLSRKKNAKSLAAGVLPRHLAFAIRTIGDNYGMGT